MFIELVDRLRCPSDHRDSWLVARMDRVEDRDIRDGALGCPVCHAEYAIRDGVVWFTEDEPPTARAADSEAAMRLAAGLALVDANKVALLDGAWGAHALPLSALTQAQLLLLNPPSGVESGSGISIVRSHAPPLAAESVDALALDSATDVGARARLLRAVRRGGRVVGSGEFEAQPDLNLMLCAESIWVAELVRPGPTIPLRRVPRAGR